jgi:hypothetical protein
MLTRGIGGAVQVCETDFYKDGFVGLFESRPHWEYRVLGAFILLSHPCEEYAVADGNGGVELAQFERIFSRFNA